MNDVIERRRRALLNKIKSNQNKSKVQNFFFYRHCFVRVASLAMVPDRVGSPVLANRKKKRNENRSENQKKAKFGTPQTNYFDSFRSKERN